MSVGGDLRSTRCPDYFETQEITQANVLVLDRPLHATGITNVFPSKLNGLKAAIFNQVRRSA